MPGGGREPSSTAAPAADHLSSLPDGALLSIVRHLPEREAVRLSILSRRWRRLPSVLPVLDCLDLSSSRSEKLGEEFDWFEEADRAMSAHWGLIRRCRLSTNRADKWMFDRWAEAIAAKGVRELELFLDDGQQIDAYPVLRHCKSLTKLMLAKGRLTGETAAVARCLGCTDLRELRLLHVNVCDDLFQDLISTTLRLESLWIVYCTGLGRLRINAAPRLRDLVFDYDDAVDIDAPDLDYLSIRMPRWWEEFAIRAPRLTYLSADLMEEAGAPPQHCVAVTEGLRSLLNDATSLDSLDLHGSFIKHIFTSQGSSFSQTFYPSFHSLTRLTVRVSLRDHQQASGLAMLLQRCNCLQVLDIKMIWHESSLNGVPSHPVLLFWDHQRMLEKMDCLNCHLQEVTMSRLTGEVYEMKLACLFLMKARALKNLTLYFRKEYKHAMHMIAEHLPKLKKGSPEAQWELHLMSYGD